MDSIEYIGPAGQRQTVDSVIAATRLRARGWVPRSDLEKLAAFRPSAAEQLRLADKAAAAREERIQQRQAAASGTGHEPATAAIAEPSAAPAESGQEPTEPQLEQRNPRKRSSKT
ncbi:hypothetical protein [Streptomyces sp. NPDC007063]|uniref:hypothetical protein n=1 Tax=Streptomyces sp. NPDC007063 TaxID=3364772 RepID=UPI0036BB83A2